MKKVNKQYEAPFMEVAEVEIECGIATSPYGGYGEAGQGSDYIDYGDENGDWLL